MIVWGAGSNCWLNAVVAHEVHKMLRSSHIRKRYFPPTRQRVACNAAVVYVYCTVLGVVSIIGWDLNPTRSEAGLICVPLPADVGSEVFFWLVFTPAFMVVPIMYVQYVVFDIWRQNLLPPKGKRRLIGVYFFRIVVVFGTCAQRQQRSIQFCYWNSNVGLILSLSFQQQQQHSHDVVPCCLFLLCLSLARPVGRLD